MHAARGNVAQALSADPSATAGGHGPLYIINLCSSNAPLALEAPNAPELGGFAVFRSRRVEDGRDRFRLHLGYFDSQEQAEKFLPLLRDRYPAAWVALAPEENLGSLDDTSVAQFKYIPLPKKVAGAPVAQAAPQPPAKAAAPATEAVSTATTVPAENFLEADDVLSLLESPPRHLPQAPAADPVRVEPAPATSAPIEVPATQSFAVQLIWSMERPDTAQIPRLAIFDAYTMYTVTMKRAGRLWYGLRLGFFNDPVSARQVSLYVRSDFAAAAVVPVSKRECDRAGEAAEAVLHKETIAREEQRKAPAKPVAKPAVKAAAAKKPDNALAAAQADFRKTLKTLDHPEEQKSAPTHKPARVTTGAARRGAFTTEQLLEELGSGDVSFEGEGHEQFSDTGVRHLSVAVVRPRKRLSGFFTRGSSRGGN